jgi:hypothetical protein
MFGTDHRITAAASWVVTATMTGLPAWQVAAGAAVAAAFSTGPDVDNTRAWKRLDGVLPDELLGAGGPLGHRRLMHWWGLPAAVAVALYLAGGPWYAWAAVEGWASHLAGDFVFGMPGYGTPIGVPLGPWWWHVGVGLRSGGRVERTVVPLAAAAVCWWVAGTPGAALIEAATRR